MATCLNPRCFWTSSLLWFSDSDNGLPPDLFPSKLPLNAELSLGSCGETVAQIPHRLDVQRPTVRSWLGRVAKEGIRAVWDIAPGGGRKPSYGKSRIARLVK
jgi:hypothetical protein